MDDLKRLSDTLQRYAKGRAEDVRSGIETPALAALLVEKYAVGLVDATRVLGVSVDINAITQLADSLCKEICPEYVALRQLRRESVSGLALSSRSKF